MRNHADEIIFIESVGTRRCVPRSALSTLSDSSSQPEKLEGTLGPTLRSRWVLVDGKLKLCWSDDREEPLRCAA
jgi:hypothetical protein